ncbi:MAG: serine acetyltransferase [Sediminibacterium magnilacihabitans]|jgi:putative colanic acid biosynthesis acetyltransferase WcaB|nr:serine acetyltransferase [Sediminibacterium magnilacihabitans]PQV61628.1 putative colanic acid biosynthesis acetyltransferase WcaB [Sediminibacterium magnilacihabitans]
MFFFQFIFQDWKANKKNPKGRIILLLFRIANFCSKRRIYFYLGAPYLIFYKILVECCFCIEIPWNVKIGRNLTLFHGQCLVMNREVVIGENCTLRHCITIGHKQVKTGGFSGSPVIGDHVDIGSNVCIIGKIHIGDHVKIGCGSIVTKTIYDHLTVLGNPAVPMHERERIL